MSGGSKGDDSENSSHFNMTDVNKEVNQNDQKVLTLQQVLDMIKDEVNKVREITSVSKLTDIVRISF